MNTVFWQTERNKEGKRAHSSMSVLWCFFYFEQLCLIFLYSQVKGASKQVCWFLNVCFLGWVWGVGVTAWWGRLRHEWWWGCLSVARVAASSSLLMFSAGTGREWPGSVSWWRANRHTRTETTAGVHNWPRSSRGSECCDRLWRWIYP